MSNSVQGLNNGVNKSSSGLCPHGMAPSACPICSQMGGGGFKRAGERAQKPGEMSYHQCAIIGAMMRARAEQMKNHKANIEARIEAQKAFEQNLANLSEKLSNIATKLSNNFFLKPAAFVLNKFAIPILNTIKNIPNIVQNIQTKFTQLKIDIQDKLNAIFGEAKAFVEKKASELISNIKSKVLNMFKIFKRNNTKDDETKIDEDKKMFRLKTFISKIWKKKDDKQNKS